MAGGLLNNLQQLDVSEQRRMPVDNIGADAIFDVVGETLQFYYFNAGVLTIDAGEAAGTTIVGKLLYRNVKSSLGDVVGHYNDTSVTLTGGTTLVTLREFPALIAEDAERNEFTLAAKAAAIVNKFTEGEYCIDHRTGTVYGLKGDANVTDTVGYKVETTVSGGAGPASDVNLTKVAGVATAAGSGVLTGGTLRVTVATDDTVATDLTAIKTATELIDDTVAVLGTTTYTETTSKGLTVGAVRNDTLAALADTDNEIAPLQVDAKGALYVTVDSASGQYADKDAFTPGTSIGNAVFGQYIAAGDNVADRQTGILAMTIDRHMMVQADGYDSGTDSQKVYEVAPLNTAHVEETLATATGQGNATTYYYFDMDGYTKFGLQIMNTDGGAGDNTYTLEGTLEDNGTVAASCDYIDISTDYTGGGSWSTAAGNLNAIIQEDDGVAYKYVRVKVVRANDGGGTDGAWEIFLKKLY